MCGIFGECSADLLNTDSFMELLQLSRQRGPDHTGTYRIDQEMQFGFNRLSIRDLSEHGHQPYHSPNKKFTMIFNGEIYNCESLISKFKLNRESFRSTSDTEVISQLSEILSADEIARELNGMYAIALYEHETKTLSLLRCFAGIKPLFYSIHEKGIVFASQFDQVYKHPAIKSNLKVNASVLKEYFALGYMQSPNTIYENIFQIDPGSVLTFRLTNLSSTVSHESQFDYKTTPKYLETDTNNIGIVNTILNEVISRQLISDVKTGTFLSGGIDSPIVTAIAAKQKNDIEAFTVKAGGEGIDESKISSKYAKHLGVKNIVAEFSNEDMVSLIDEHFRAYPEPFGDYSSLPTYLICKLASEKFKVLLSGDGGDELFWGYPRFYNTLRHANWFAMPRIVRMALAKIVRSSGKKVSYGIESKTIGDWVLGQHSHNKLNIVDSFFKSQISITKELKALYSYKGTAKNRNLMQWLRWNEFYGHMQRILTKVDRASMGNSLEVRVPFLDKENIEFAFSIAPDLANENHKSILKAVMRSYYPESLINKKKMGFTIDIEIILKEYCKSDFYRLLNSDKVVGKEILNIKGIVDYVDAYFTSKHFNGWGVWIIYSYFKWSEIHN